MGTTEIMIQGEEITNLSKDSQDFEIKRRIRLNWATYGKHSELS